MKEVLSAKPFEESPNKDKAAMIMGIAQNPKAGTTENLYRITTRFLPQLENLSLDDRAVAIQAIVSTMGKINWEEDVLPRLQYLSPENKALMIVEIARNSKVAEPENLALINSTLRWSAKLSSEGRAPVIQAIVSTKINWGKDVLPLLKSHINPQVAAEIILKIAANPSRENITEVLKNQN